MKSSAIDPIYLTFRYIRYDRVDLTWLGSKLNYVDMGLVHSAQLGSESSPYFTQRYALDAQWYISTDELHLYVDLSSLLYLEDLDVVKWGVSLSEWVEWMKMNWRKLMIEWKDKRCGSMFKVHKERWSQLLRKEAKSSLERKLV